MVRLAKLAGLLVTPNCYARSRSAIAGRDFRDEEQIAARRCCDSFVRLLAHSVSRGPKHYRKENNFESRPALVIGVLPRSLGPYYEELEIFAPLVLTLTQAGNVRAGKMRVQIIARLKTGVTLQQARSEAKSSAGGLEIRALRQVACQLVVEILPRCSGIPDRLCKMPGAVCG